MLLPLDQIQGRLGDEDPAGDDQRLHVAKEERQQQRSDVRSVHVGVGHDDDLAIAALAQVDLLVADAAVQGGGDVLDFVVTEHLVDAGLFHIEDLSPQRQDRLDRGVSSLLGGPAGRVALHQKQLGGGDVLAPTVGELPGK